MIYSTALCGCTVSLLTAYGVKKWWWDTKDHPWYNRLSVGINDDFSTLWKCIIGKRNSIEINKEKLKMPEQRSSISSSAMSHNILPNDRIKYPINENFDRSLEIDRIVAEGLEGWSETAKELSREELEENSSNVRANSINNTNNTLSVPLTLNNKTMKSITKNLNEKDLARATMEHLEGWGENAAEFAKEEYEELNDSNTSDK